MLNPRRILISQSVLDSSLCLLCSSYRVSLALRRTVSNASSPAGKTPVGSPRDKKDTVEGPALALGEKTEEKFTPKPLARPLGFPNPPKAGQNVGVDTRTWRQRREDFFDYHKHLERRKLLAKKISTPYFREWTNMRHHKGKTFLSNPKLFRADRALYFPNLHGKTLLSPRRSTDTTPVLQGKISVVGVFSSTWAERQVQTFVGETQNPELGVAIRESGGVAGRVDVNVEENALKAALIRLFMPSIRREIPRERHGRYFVVRRGISEEIRDAIGFLNGKVGYVYLLDGECRIRWAGSGRAGGEEKEGLVRGVRRLVDEWRRRREEGAVVSGDADGKVKAMASA
ncbi:MAG: Mitochondrial ATPase complex subunit atp10 [Geoglossum umbratile]|nr:MAG: Mitochondrial ATPase complex subunit atp10 [Geoglossum umbratile]